MDSHNYPSQSRVCVSVMSTHLSPTATSRFAWSDCWERSQTAARSRVLVPPRRSRVSCTSETGFDAPSRPSQEAYNRAMQAYSQQPYMYQHDAGLCACPTWHRLTRACYTT